MRLLKTLLLVAVFIAMFFYVRSEEEKVKTKSKLDLKTTYAVLDNCKMDTINTPLIR